MSRHISLLNPPGMSSPTQIYSHIAVVPPNTRLIYTAGQIGVDIHGKASADYTEQIQQAFDNLGNCLREVGATPKDIVKIVFYIVDYNPEKRMHAKIMADFLQGHQPPSTLVPVPCLARAGLLFEVEAVAAVAAVRDDTQAITNSTSSAIALPIKTDVLIIGAGLSGLQAARDVQKAGLSCIVLEARNRVGGKVWSYVSPKGTVDLGAAWTNDVNQTHLWRLGKELGLEFTEQNAEGDCVIQTSEGVSRFKYGDVPKYSIQEQNDFIGFRDLVETLCHKIDTRKPGELDDLTLEAFVSKHSTTRATLSSVGIWTRAMLGLEPSEVSALYFLHYCKSGGGLMQMRSDQKGGGQALRCKTGMMSFPRGLALKLKSGTIKLNSPVQSITQVAPSKVAVSTRDGLVYEAQKVIVTLPTPLYKEVNFSPSLPVEKLRVSDATILGYYSKAIVLYDRPWWSESGLCGLSQSFIGPISITRDTSTPSLKQYSLTCFIVGEPGRIWSQMADRKSAVLKQLVSIFGPTHTRDAMNPIEYVEQEWSKEEFSKGCPCPVTAIGNFSGAEEALQKPFGDIHFVGTETADAWKGYMEGAVRSGVRGAGEVITSLAKDTRLPGAKL